MGYRLQEVVNKVLSHVLKPKTYSLTSASRGFTLIELLVVAGIVVVVTSIILANNSQFGGMITLENLSYDMALSIRQAQVYGIAVRRFGSNNYNVGYGMHFEKTSATSYTLFGDAILANGFYDQGELVQLSTLQGGYRISDLCVRQSGSLATTCATYTCGLDKLDILFKRPEPDAFIRANGDSALNEAACIIITSPRSTADKRSIVVEATGQISVQP